jgi:hypothetical protein
MKTIAIGQRVRATRDICLGRFGHVMLGERGTVTDVCDDLGERVIDVRWDGGKVMTLAEPDTDALARVYEGPKVRAPVTVMAALAVCLTAAAASIEGEGLWSEVPLLEVSNVMVENPTLRAGETLHLHFNYQRNQLCAARIDRAVSTTKDDTVTWFESTSGGAITTATGVPGYWRIPVRLPTHLTPGEYSYRSVMHHDCHDGEYHKSTVLTNGVRFTIIE